MTAPDVRAWRDRLRSELFEEILPFWQNFSIDDEHGGFFTCLDHDGKRYDDRKHVWLQGRQVWMFAKIYNLYPDEDELARLSGGRLSRARLLEAARRGAAFLRKHGFSGDGNLHFCLTADGRPLAAQRKPWGMCFLVLAVIELSRAVEDAAEAEEMRAEATRLFGRVVEYMDDPSLLGRPDLAGAPPTSSLALPMIRLSLLSEMATSCGGGGSGGGGGGGGKGGDGGASSSFMDPAALAAKAAECVDEILRHRKPDLRLVLETVGPEGALLDTIEGRTHNPGHSIEAGWFLLEHALALNDEGLQSKAIDMIEWSFDAGWDEEHGGIFYFLDRDGYSPTELEWPMKLWWPHCEAMIGFALAFSVTRSKAHWERFVKVADYSFAHFKDHTGGAGGGGGEWFGYCDREGRVSHKFKAGPYKGCFHVPRALLLCMQILDRVLLEPRGGEEGVKEE